MANTTYISPVINAGNKLIAYNALTLLISHIVQNQTSGTGLYQMDILSVIHDTGGTNRIQVILTDPLPPGQVARYNLTLVP